MGAPRVALRAPVSHSCCVCAVDPQDSESEVRTCAALHVTEMAQLVGADETVAKVGAAAAAAAAAVAA